MEKRLSAALIAVVSLIRVIGPLSADDGDFSVSVTGLRTYWFGFVPTGLDLAFTYGGIELIDGYDTFIHAGIGGGYEEHSLYRDTDGSPYSGTNTNGEASYMLPNGQFETGIFQGFAWNERLSKNLISAFVLYRTRYERAIDDPEIEQLVFDTAVFPDRYGMFGNSLLLGLRYDDLSKDAVHRTADGFLAEASMEWGPRFLLNTLYGESDYYRFSAGASAFHTLYDAAPESPKSVFSIYLADYASVDWAGGETIPLYVMQSFGGTKLRDGLGKSVRGFETWSYDTRFKAVNNFEIRVNGPSLFHPKLIPGMVAYLDAGYYDSYHDDPEQTAGGMLVSTGIGINLYVFGLEYIGLFVDFPLVGERIDGRSWAISVPFGLHF